MLIDSLSSCGNINQIYLHVSQKMPMSRQHVKENSDHHVNEMRKNAPPNCHISQRIYHSYNTMCTKVKFHTQRTHGEEHSRK